MVEGGGGGGGGGDKLLKPEWMAALFVLGAAFEATLETGILVPSSQTARGGSGV